MPRAPKPHPLRQNRERRDVGRIDRRTPLPEPPPVPFGLLKATRQAWAAYWRSEISLLVEAAADMPAIERLFWLYDQRIRMQRAIRRQPFVAGSMGQTRLNPGYDAIRKFDPEIRALEDRFGRSPKSRLELGVVIGDRPADAELEDLNATVGADDDAPDPRLIVLDGGAR